MTSCLCNSRTCELFGCQRDAADRQRFKPLQGHVPPMNPPPLYPGQTREVRILTEADVRRIIREELAKGAQND